MKYLIAFAALFAANALQHLPVMTGIGIMIFSGLFIFTVMTAKSPIRWKLSIQLPKPVGILKDILDLTAVLLLIVATAVILVAIAATGPDLSFPEALLIVVKSLPRMLDV